MKNLLASMILPGLVFTGLISCKHSTASFQQQLQEQFVKANPGDVIEVPEGKFQLDRTLSLSADKVTIRGKGMDKSILSFAGQKEGGPGLLVKANDFVIEDLAIEDTAGDGLKVQGGNNITIRRVRVEWTRGANAGNGAYAILPTECKNVLVEDSVARGATNAGFHIGQSDHVVMRRNRAEHNVDGYEVENSQHVDVYDNIASNNTGGLGVFNMPNLPRQGEDNIRVFRNQIFANNAANFAPESLGAIYHLPAGTGIYMMAIRYVEVFQNKIHENNTSNISIISYDPNPYVIDGRKAAAAYNPGLGEVKNHEYNRFTEYVYIHGNEIWEGGRSPDVRQEEVRLLSMLGGADVLYDGVVDPATRRLRRGPNPAEICLDNNGVIRFLDYDYEGGKLWKHPDFRIPVRDVKIYGCMLPQLEAVVIPQVPAQAGPPEWEEKVGDTRLALVDPGKISGNTYRNDALGFSYEFPSGWTVVDHAAQEKLMDAAIRDFYNGADPPADEHEARALCMHVLLWTTKYPETFTNANPLAIVLAVVPDCDPGINVPVKDSERKYLREDIGDLSAPFTGSSLLGEDDQKIRNFVRHGRDFVQVSTIRTTDVRTDKPKKPIHSAVILTQVKGYWLAWLLVSDTHSELQQLQKLKVQFD